MTVKVSSIGLKGLEGYRVQVQVRISPGKESVVVVGLPDASVRESRERVVAAISCFGMDVTDQKKWSLTCLHQSRRKMVHYLIWPLRLQN